MLRTTIDENSDEEKIKKTVFMITQSLYMVILHWKETLTMFRVKFKVDKSHGLISLIMDTDLPLS